MSVTWVRRNAEAVALVDAAGGSETVQLPNMATTEQVTVNRIDSSGNTVTVTVKAGRTLDGVTNGSTTVSADSSKRFLSLDAGWESLTAAGGGGGGGVTGAGGGTLTTTAQIASDTALSGTYAPLAPDWATGEVYVAGQMVVDAGTLYRCTTAHTAGGSFAAGNFAALGGGGGGGTIADGSVTTAKLAANAVTAAKVAGDVATTAALTSGLAGKLDASAAVALATAGQTPSQAPVALGTQAVGSLAYAARADHVHPAAGEHAWFGDGSAGDITLDGTNTYSSTSKSGNVYTLTDALMARNLTISAGVTLVMAAGSLHVSGTLTNSGTISSVGGNASGATAGSAAVFTAGTLNFPGAGAAGGTGVGAASLPPRTATNANPGSSQAFGGLAGAGGTGASGAGGAQSSLDYQHNFSAKNIVRAPFFAFGGILPPNAAGSFLAHFGAAGGASGAGDGTNSGGGGGGGGGCILINARAVVNNGSITANGGNGGTPSTGNCGGGGGGGGGPVFINTGSAVTGSGTVTNAGGSAGTGVGSGLAGAAGQAGHQQIIVWP